MANAPKKEPNIHQRLLAISHDAEVAKGGTAPGAVGGFAFHKIDDVEAVLKPLFHKHGVMAIPTLREPMEFSPNGSWNIATAHVEVTFVNVDNPDDVVTVSFPGQGFDKQDKAAGKAISYACKNAYLSVFHLKGQPDVEADAHTEHVAADANGSKAWKRMLWNTAKENGWQGKGVADAIFEKWQFNPDDVPQNKRKEVIEFFDTTTPQMWEDEMKGAVEEFEAPKGEELF